MRFASGLVLTALLLFSPLPVPAQDPPLPAELEEAGVSEKLGESVDLNLTFVDESGRLVRLGDYFKAGLPVILNLVYYSCPMLCTLVLNGQVDALRDIPWTPGEQFTIVTVTIDPAETHELARAKKQMYLENYGRPAPGWHFLTDYSGNVRKLAEQVGFRYRYDESQKQFAHAAAIMLLTPEGKVARYLYGINYRPRDLRLALTEAAEGKFGLSVERLLLFCFHYDPQARSYVLFATNIMRAGGVLIVLALGFVLFRFWRRERKTPAGG